MQFPHCDQRILHAVGECEVCNTYASDLQEIRDAWQINFSGHDDEGKLLRCPADVARGSDAYNRWGGNVPVRGKTLGFDYAGYPVTEADPRLEEERVRALAWALGRSGYGTKEAGKDASVVLSDFDRFLRGDLEEGRAPERRVSRWMKRNLRGR